MLYIFRQIKVHSPILSNKKVHSCNCIFKHCVSQVSISFSIEVSYITLTYNLAKSLLQQKTNYSFQAITYVLGNLHFIEPEKNKSQKTECNGSKLAISQHCKTKQCSPHSKHFLSLMLQNSKKCYSFLKRPSSAKKNRETEVMNLSYQYSWRVSFQDYHRH